MSESDFETSFEAFETFEANKLAADNMRSVVAMVRVALQSDIHMSTHTLSLIPDDYRTEQENVFRNPSDVRRIAHSSVQAFHAMFSSSNRTERETSLADETTTGRYVIWDAQIENRTVNVIEKWWEPEGEYDLGVNVSAHFYQPPETPKTDTAEVLPEQRVGRLGRFISRLFRKQ